MSNSIISTKSSMESLQTSLLTIPDKLAPAVAGSMVWEGSELDPTKYVLSLSAFDIQSIRSAVISFKVLGLPRAQIDKTTFPLSSHLAQKLSSMRTELHNGFGVAVLRGLDAANLNDEEAVIAFVGICTYVATLRATDSYANQTLSHVRDATHDAVPEWAKDIGLAGSKITDKMDFHSDRFSGDILALHVRDDGGAHGGEQYVASFWKIYNELLDKDPAVLEAMAEANWPFELRQKNRNPYLELGPTLFFSKGKPMCQLVKAPLLGSPRIPRDPSMPTVSEEQIHALQVVENLARQFSTKLDRQNGDIQFINNLSILHARGAYGNDQERSTRHLLRMFLRDTENPWEKSGPFKTNFDDPFTVGRQQNLPVYDFDPWRKISGRESHG